LSAALEELDNYLMELDSLKRRGMIPYVPEYPTEDEDDPHKIRSWIMGRQVEVEEYVLAQKKKQQQGERSVASSLSQAASGIVRTNTDEVDANTSSAID